MAHVGPNLLEMEPAWYQCQTGGDVDANPVYGWSFDAKERAGSSDPMNKVWLIVTRMMRCVDKHKAGFYTSAHIG